uniref:Short-chain dehydrogenase/reductase malC n=1 Tax=Malbranchea aurantiaca TaxID=78605 RepID=MALC_MALAU|nr:RecName: Full=Short-chain dehydrogenase/reductase malC; AltName: Full=Malbrancheamide biosynthesis cluster protein C [Malbranchea aurantiaca]6NKH_A Chain A, Short chain dehydrogenase [Malbranchea aurantiaca]6NKH_B Chain B, Short chain dehydrogenase [Malbranchea aurantiaca]6NKH_C Chain C, Short chain dehydrogenase [Malbranchea aurantiaca]6NKH_D Chain D, Short chain dehydrogenase [Malbranchea aurantiaca]AGA37263.1 short chain dehydrogenase [Malbranchea aurantiaca]
MAPTRRSRDLLRGKNVLIIGGTSGIGFAVAQLVIEHGAMACIAGSNPTKLGKALDALKQHPDRDPIAIVQSATCDLFDVPNLEQNLDNLLKLAAGDSKIHHIVFTAADMVQPPPLASVTIEQIQRVGTIRFTAPMLVAKLLPKYMELCPENSYTLTSGSHAKQPDPGWSLVTGYCGGVEGLMRGLAVDMMPLRVNVVSPGAVLTPVLRDILGDSLEIALDAARKKSTTGRIARPEDVAEAYLYIMKDQNITGTVLETSAGMLLR